MYMHEAALLLPIFPLLQALSAAMKVERKLAQRIKGKTNAEGLEASGKHKSQSACRSPLSNCCAMWCTLCLAVPSQ